ncbi:MAG TPA: glycosyltransferase family 1 protein [Candidatus Woesearchaeota archaeon]|nr:glycosyltransferase family 1 protein [Candidatus Woesearchaeota archaeon]
MKVFITSDTFLPKKDGISMFLSMLIPELTKRGIDVRLVVPSLGATKFDGIARKIRVFKHIKGADYFAPHFGYWAIKHEMKNADVVFNQTVASLGISTLLAGRVLRKKVISYVHLFGWEVARYNFGFAGNVLWRIVRFIEKHYYSKSTSILVSYKGGADKLRSAGIYNPIDVVPLGVDLKRFNPSGREHAKAELGLEDKLTIGYCGRISCEKDPLTLLRGFELLRRKVDCNLILVGPILRRFERYVKGREKEGIFYFGVVDDVVPYLKAIDIFVMPSLTETMSLATVEAMACGCATVATKVGAIPEYIVNGENGFFFPRRNYFILYERLLNLANDDGLRKEFGRKGVMTARKFDFKNTVDRLVEVFTSAS